MTNYEKIKKLLETNTCYVLIEDEKKNKIICSSFTENDIIGCSRIEDKIEGCYNSLGRVPYGRKELDEKLNITSITPLPISHKKIKGNVDIIDCEEIRRIAEKDVWGEDKIKMIGKKDLQIGEFYNDKEGQSYSILNHNRVAYNFPAIFVIPTDCQTVEEKNEMTDEELLKELESRGLLEDKKVIK